MHWHPQQWRARHEAIDPTLSGFRHCGSPPSNKDDLMDETRDSTVLYLLIEMGEFLHDWFSPISLSRSVCFSSIEHQPVLKTTCYRAAVAPRYFVQRLRNRQRGWFRKSPTSKWHLSYGRQNRAPISLARIALTRPCHAFPFIVEKRSDRSKWRKREKRKGEKQREKIHRANYVKKTNDENWSEIKLVTDEEHKLDYWSFGVSAFVMSHVFFFSPRFFTRLLASNFEQQTHTD